MKLDAIKCDCCGRVVGDIASLHWESKPSIFRLKFPRDGINGGDWSMDVCQKCRHVLFDAIKDTISDLKRAESHSIHCAGYRGGANPFDEAACDCREIKEQS